MLKPTVTTDDPHLMETITNTHPVRGSSVMMAYKHLPKTFTEIEMDTQPIERSTMTTKKLQFLVLST